MHVWIVLEAMWCACCIMQFRLQNVGAQKLSKQLMIAHAMIDQLMDQLVLYHDLRASEIPWSACNAVYCRPTASETVTTPPSALPAGDEVAAIQWRMQYMVAAFDTVMAPR